MVKAQDSRSKPRTWSGHRAARLCPAPPAGFTMIEVLITMLLLTVVLMGLAALQVATVRQVSLSNRASGALRLAQSVIERYQATTFASLPSATPDWEAIKMKDGLTDMVGVWEDGEVRKVGGKDVAGPYSAYQFVESPGGDRLITVRVTWLDLMPGSESVPTKKYRTLQVLLTMRRRNI